MIDFSWCKNEQHNHQIEWHNALFPNYRGTFLKQQQKKNSITNRKIGFISSGFHFRIKKFTLNAYHVTDGPIEARCRVTLLSVDKVLTLYIIMVEFGWRTRYHRGFPEIHSNYSGPCLNDAIWPLTPDHEELRTWPVFEGILNGDRWTGRWNIRTD